MLRHILPCRRPVSLGLNHSQRLLHLRNRNEISRHVQLFRRSLTSTQDSSSQSQSPPSADVYHGPLTTTFRRLKIFSVSSLGLSCTLAPFFFILESSLPFYGRVMLAGIALTTSGLSTAMISWSGRPYVTTLRRVRNDGMQGVEMTTNTMFLRNLVTTVYDVTFLVETRRPLAKWELAKVITLPPARSNEVHSGQEETVAETRNAEGKVVGRWIVMWDDDGRGTCRQEGQVVRHFSVHEELLKG